MVVSVETIKSKVALRDYDFFLSQPQFFKIVDSLSKYQEAHINLDSQEGRDFVVFKR